jgi:hypothetical protein
MVERIQFQKILKNLRFGVGHAMIIIKKSKSKSNHHFHVWALPVVWEVMFGGVGLG